ncbi:MAG: NUDIX domain-containing protein [Bacteroidales bacterium]|nr:NUDIX domain-containing protein [Bacteroidales bacterium]
MSKECSIYFDKRKIVLTNSVELNFNSQNGLFTSYNSLQELSKILEFFQSAVQVENVFISGKNVQSMLKDFCKMFRIIKASGGLVQNSKGEYLFIFRYGKWDLPKGKLEPDEKIEDAAVREVSEETGISNLILGEHIKNTYHTYKQGGSIILKETHWFNMLYSGNEPLVPQQAEDISVAKWFPANRLDEILNNTYDTIREVLIAKGIV